MKVLIITQRLSNNYGGIIQNYALQTVLKKYNHAPITLDIAPRQTPVWLYLCSWIKTFLFRLIGKKRKFAKISKIPMRKPKLDHFVSNNIEITDLCRSYTKKQIVKYNADVIVVGSDQVWRPKCNSNYGIENMYLKFAEGLPMKRIAYAASFGVDEWEYSPKQTCVCSKLAKKFDAISVREKSGVNLCKDHLGVDATWVLDPTLLLKKEDYCEVCKDIVCESEKILAAYVLDMNDSIRDMCQSIAKERGLVVKIFRADSEASLSIPEWLAMFRDASYVVTDSFHGTVFSIIFEKEFKCVYNKSRGNARFESLLSMYDSGKLEEMREFSLNWLKNALEK